MDPLIVVALCLLCPMPPSQVHRQGGLGDEVNGMKGDTIKLLNEDDGRSKRGVLCGSHKAAVPKCVNVWFLSLRT